MFLEKCKREGATIDSSADLSDILVGYYLRDRPKTAKRCAAALREAALQGINVGDLTSRLGNVGPYGMRGLFPTTIDAMAEAFANRVQKKSRVSGPRGRT